MYQHFPVSCMEVLCSSSMVEMEARHSGPFPIGPTQWGAFSFPGFGSCGFLCLDCGSSLLLGEQFLQDLVLPTVWCNQCLWNR